MIWSGWASAGKRCLTSLEEGHTGFAPLSIQIHILFKVNTNQSFRKTGGFPGPEGEIFTSCGFSWKGH